jgi:hypothetical protein
MPFPHIIRICRHKIFCLPGVNTKIFLVSLWSSCTHTVHTVYSFWRSLSVKAVKDKDFIPNIQIYFSAFTKFAERNLTYTTNSRNDIAHMLRICGIKFEVYLANLEFVMFLLSAGRMCVRIQWQMKLYVYWDNTEWNFTYSESTLNKWNYINRYR